MPVGVYDRSVRLTAEQRKERKTAYMRRRYAANRELFLAKNREYYAGNREAFADHNKRYYAENRDRCLANAKRYAIANPEVPRRSNEKRRAIKRNATIGNTKLITAWEAKWRSRKTVKCHWCGKRIKPTEAHADHVIPLSKGGAHAVDNLCVACAACNLSKTNKLPDVWNAKLSQPLLFV